MPNPANPAASSGGAARKAQARSASDGRRTRWDAHRVRRRGQLVEAALEVLGEVGPEFGLDQVAARAGVTKPVIYRHFADRAALIEAMGEAATVRLLGRLLPALHADAPLLPRIRRSVDAFLAFVDESPNVYWIFVRHAPAGGADVARADKELIAHFLTAVLGDVLSRLDTGFDVGTDAAEVWAHGLVGFVQNTAEWWLEHRPMSRDAVADHLTALIWAQIDGFARRHGVVLDPGER